MHVELLEEAARLYGARVVELKPLSGGNYNRVYEFTRDGEPCILRLAPPDDEIDTASLQAVLEWQQYLADHGGPAPEPVRSLRGLLVEHAGAQGEVLVTAVRKARGLPGEWLPFERWNEELFRSLGRATGKMHALAKDYRPAVGAPLRPLWDAASNCFNPRPSPDISLAPVWGLRRQVLEELHCLPRERDGFGLIHADLHSGNFLVDEASGEITVFDFDDCAYGWFGMDIAMSLLDMLVLYPGPDREAFAARYLRAFLADYRSENPLSAFWVMQTPLFLKLLELGLYLMLYADYEPGETDSWIGRFMHGRRERLEAGLPFVELDFSAF